MADKTSSANDAAHNWWRTSIIDVAPGRIDIRGRPIQELIGSTSLPQMIWLMTRGELPDERQAALLEAALVAAVDHGPLAPSISIARMAATCGVGLNGAMASAINVLGDVHGGAGQACAEIYMDIAGRIDAGASLQDAVRASIVPRLERGEHIPGFGHRYHKVDPRAVKLLELVEAARCAGTVSGRFSTIGRGVEDAIAASKGSRLPMNIDGATAVIFTELGFPPQLARGLFILSRSIGILAHAYEQVQQGGRIKGPVPPSVGYVYEGRTGDIPPAPQYGSTAR